MILSDESGSDLFNLMCGPKLGTGQHREVYECAMDDSRVVKHDHGTNWSNIEEYKIWCEYRDTPIGKWLAPVHWISPRGLWLIQSRTKPIEIGKFPKRIPALFADIKPDNWGLLDGRPVCHDYGNHGLFIVGFDAARALRPAVWEHYA